MSLEELQNSPLHGLSAETMLTELVEFYGWAVLDAAIDLKCFRIKPTIPSCLTFLKKAEWARNRATSTTNAAPPRRAVSTEGPRGARAIRPRSRFPERS